MDPSSKAVVALGTTFSIRNTEAAWLVTRRGVRADARKMLRLFVRNVKTSKLSKAKVNADEQIEVVRVAWSHDLGVPSDADLLLYSNGTVLEDGRTFRSYGLKNWLQGQCCELRSTDPATIFQSVGSRYCESRTLFRVQRPL